MGKRRTDNLRSPQEAKQDRQKHYDSYIRTARRESGSGEPIPVRKRRKPSEAIKLLHDPNMGCARTCRECECTNSKGFCDNYFLYAVLRDMCRVPAQIIKEASAEAGMYAGAYAAD